ncbi:phosphotransacetylase family protein [bacterium]|nr:phosphotransacetylase family protein [bacterium]
MKSIYITSVDKYSGKTALSLVIGKLLKAKDLKVGYLKPLSFQPWRIGDKIADEDAAFVREVLQLSTQPWDLSPIVITPEFLSERLQMEDQSDLLELVKEKDKAAAAGNDVMIYEGGGSLREGYVVDLQTHKMAQELNSKALAIVRYKDKRHLVDDALAAKSRLGNLLMGVIFNRVPSDANDFICKDVIPYLKSKGVTVYGLLPETKTLEALTLQEAFDVLDAELLTEYYNPEGLIEALMVGAMTAEAALSRFRKQPNKAVITGGDRSDIQLAALETSTACLILTGNLHPSPLVVKQAEDLGVAIFLVPSSTMETVEKLEQVFGKTRMGQHTKLDKFEKLVNQFVDVDQLFKDFDLSK